MAAKLDRTRPFGEVYGQFGYRYEQDGKRFDAAGNEVGAPAGEKPKAASPTSDVSAIDAQLAAQADSDGGTNAAPAVENPEPQPATAQPVARGGKKRTGAR